MLQNNLLRWFVLACLLASGETALALKSDKEQPIEVTSDSADRDEKSGVTTYNGNVVIKQGTLLIQAEHVVIKTTVAEKTALEELVEITTTGHPSHFQQQIKTESDLVDATAITINYRVNDKTVDLIDQAILKQQGRVLTGDKISYDVSAERVIANGEATQEKPANRVTVIIPAKAKNPNANGAPPPQQQQPQQQPSR